MEFTPKPMTDDQWRYWEQEDAQSGRQSSLMRPRAVQALGRRKRWLPSLQPTCSWMPIGILLRFNASLGTSPNI